ncbi:MAG: 4'-phosphopantetheinyl transferase family protein [Atopobiaceae bacterium]|jgi:phosphopantetheinyl transferase
MGQDALHEPLHDLRCAHTYISILHTAVLADKLTQAERYIAPRYTSAASASAQRRCERAGEGMLLYLAAHVTQDADICLGEFGKPELSRAAAARVAVPAGEKYVRAVALGADLVHPHISISHDAGLVVLALADEPVGVDVSRLVLNERVASRSLAPFLPKDWPHLADPARTYVCTRAWCELESVLKAMGTGFTADYRRHPELLEGWHHTTFALVDDGIVEDSFVLDEEFSKRLATVTQGPSAELPKAVLSLALRTPFDVAISWQDEAVSNLLAKGSA